MYDRKQMFKDAAGESLFFWGARQTGKTTLLRTLFPDVLWFDLLLTEEYGRLNKNPEYLRKTILAMPTVSTVVIDEIQRVPQLLNEVHWLIVNRGIRFILSGSSPRKILRSGANLLGGRALRYELFPLVTPEIPDFDLMRAINNGLLPRHYDADNASKLLSAYIGSYLRDEIVAEARLRNVSVFSRFLEAAAFTNGEIVNYSNIATDIGVSMPTVKDYFQILEDTLLGRFLPSFQNKPKRRIIQAPKFYMFDVGIVNSLLNRGTIGLGTEIFGKAFEHFIYQEIYAHSHYSESNYTISHWHTATHREVDFILGDHEVAIEVKSTKEAQSRHIGGLKTFAEDYTVKKLILVSNDLYPRLLDNVLILPWKVFLEKLWAGEIIH
ncbi:ATPase [Bacteroidia bacterium]|nr:ATPase [Bacteroidia bacterium]